MFDNFFYLSPLLAILICLSSFFRYRRLVKETKRALGYASKLEYKFNEIVRLRKIEKVQFEAAMQDRFGLDLDDDFDGLDLDLDLDDDDDDLYLDLDDDLDLDEEPKPKLLPKPKPKRLPLLRR
jgi:hypothetical protein